jgi:hypothetical protein
MNDSASRHFRAFLMQSLPAVEERKAELEDRLANSLRRSEQDPELSDHPEMIARLLLDFLIRQARHGVGSDAPPDLSVHRAQQEIAGIDGRHYSRFGDALVPVFRDALGPTYPRDTASAWSDLFWSSVQRLRAGSGAAAPDEDSTQVFELVG